MPLRFHIGERLKYNNFANQVGFDTNLTITSYIHLQSVAINEYDARATDRALRFVFSVSLNTPACLL